MFDCYYCVNSATMLQKLRNFLGIIFRPHSHSYKHDKFSQNSHSRPWSAIIIFVQPLAAIHGSKSPSVNFHLISPAFPFLHYPNLYSSCIQVSWVLAQVTCACFLWPESCICKDELLIPRALSCYGDNNLHKMLKIQQISPKPNRAIFFII